MADGPSISAFLPAHNEVGAIGGVVTRLCDVLAAHAEVYEVIVVDDGSTDGTGALADRLARDDPHVRAVHHPVNRGYGGALRSGFAACRYDLVFFTDGDGQFDVGQLPLLLERIDGHDVVCGYRLDRQDLPHRRLFGWAWTVFVNRLFGLDIRDIDCAFKLLRRRFLDGLDLTSTGAMISTELLLKLKLRGCRLCQVGMHHLPRRSGESSGGSVRVIARALVELVRFRRRMLPAMRIGRMKDEG